MELFDKWISQLENNLSEREIVLIKKAGNILIGNICYGEKYPWYPYRCIRPFKFPEYTPWAEGIWNWDSAFHAIGVMRWDTELAKEQILGFIQFQLESGMFVDVVRQSGEIESYSSKPPVFAHAVAEIYRCDGDIDFVKKVYPKLVFNLRYWERERMSDGMFHYGADLNRTPFLKLDQYIRWESGWDNSVRWDNPCADYWAIDLNCFMVMTYRALAILADVLGRGEEASSFRERETALIENINKYCWNDEYGIYADVDRFRREKSKILTPASFMPMYIGIATPERASHMAEYAADKSKFFPGMPTVSYDDPEYSQTYWRGNTWLNVAYFAAKGLKEYGFDETADQIKEIILGWVENDGENIHENYDSSSGKGLYCSKFSWSSVFVIEFILNW